ncbi:hypothetical protein D1007_19926 [Hordeum vulgare]|nr:hypothetical protein D1007_19926 [Hordeum vulgare]
MEVMEARERLPKETKGKTKKQNRAWDEAQSAFNKEEVQEVDFLQPYFHLLSPSLIELLRFCETTRARNTYLTREVVLLEKHITNIQGWAECMGYGLTSSMSRTDLSLVRVLFVGFPEAGTKASARTTVSSVQMLALQLHFGDRNQVKMLPSFLRCFPNLDTLIIESFLETTSNRSLKFWQGTSPIECVGSHLKTLSFCELQGNDDEFDFIMFIVENAPKLERLIIQIKQDLTYTERQMVVAKLGDLSCASWANTNCKVRLEISGNPIGSSWSIEAGSDLSSDDPFSCL